MFIYFNFEYYVAMLKRIWAKKEWPGRTRLLLRLLLAVPAIYLFHSIFFFLDKIVFPSLWSKKITKPVFVVGHARSGTTLLHRLLAADSDRFSYFLYWEMFFPSLLQKKIIRGLGVLDQKVLNSYLFNKLKAWDDKTFGPARHVHNMGLWIPEEDDFVLNTTFFAGYWQLQAPMMDTMDVFYLDRQHAKRRARVMGYYRECVRRQLYLNGGERTHLSKNPVFCGRVETLIEAFPDARIVVIVRDPIECVPSGLKLMEGNYRYKGWKREDYAPSLKVLEQMSYDCYKMPRQALEKNPQVPHYSVDYRELVAQPKVTIEKVYAALDMPVTNAYQAVLEQKDKSAKQHKTRHSYSAEEFGIDVKKMQRELAEFYAQYEWELGLAPK